MSNTNITTTTETTTVVVEENIVRIELNNIGVQGVPGANNDPVYVTVRNATGSLITKGSIVYVSGGNGTHTQVTKALATSDATSARVLGWLAADIANNADGLCMVEGYLDGVDTQGVTEGAQLYLSGTVAGAYQVTKPVAPIHLVYVGVAVKASAGNGRVYVKVQNGYELNELHDVLIVNPTNNQVLAYDSATQLWKNAVNAPDGVTSITATAPLTGGTITSTGSIGLDQTALSITRSQVSDFTSGTVTSASTAQQAGTAVYAVNSGTAVYSTTSGTAVYSVNSGTAVTISGTITKSQVSDFTSGTVASASTAQQSGTAVYAVNSGTAVFATTAGTSTTISGDITRSQVSDFASGTVAQAGTATYAVNSGTAVFATNASTAVSVSGSAITQSQVVNLVSDLAGKANLTGGNAFTGNQTIVASGTTDRPLIVKGFSGQTANLFEARSSADVLMTRIDRNGAVSATYWGPVGSGLTGYLEWITSTPTFYSGAAATVGMIVKGHASQSADLFKIQNSAATDLLYATPTGDWWVTGAVRSLFYTNKNNTGGYLNYSSNSPMFEQRIATEVALRVRGASGQTADLLELQNSSSVDLVSVNASGGVVIGSTHLPGASPSVGQIRTSTDTGSNYIDTTVNSSAATGPGLTARRARGTLASPTQVQANDLLFGIFAQGWNDAGAFSGNSVAIRMLANQNFTTTALGSSIVFETASDGTTGRAERMRVTGSGTLSIGTTAVTGQLGVVSADAARVGLIVRGAASASANLQEWQNSGSTALASVNNIGIAQFYALGVSGNPSGIAFSYFTTPLPAVVPVVVRGAASQSANLQEWQNSAGTVLASVSSAGLIRSSDNIVAQGPMGTTGGAAGTTRIASLQANSAGLDGGWLQLRKVTSAVSNPGSSLGNIYFRDGTNAGTLKLVVRAGAAGAETTILDNIPT